MSDRRLWKYYRQEKLNFLNLQKIHLKDCDFTKSMLQSPYIDVRFGFINGGR